MIMTMIILTACIMITIMIITIITMITMIIMIIIIGGGLGPSRWQPGGPPPRGRSAAAAWPPAAYII